MVPKSQINIKLNVNNSNILFGIFCRVKNETIFNFFADTISHIRVFLKLEKVAENDVGNYYIDFDSIKNENGLVYYTDLVDFIEPFKGRLFSN